MLNNTGTANGQAEERATNISEISHNGRCHASDLHKLEIEELKRALADHTDILQATEVVHIQAAAAQAWKQEQGIT